MSFLLHIMFVSNFRYGSCWKAALENLKEGCQNLDDEIQTKLALNFANCFLEKAGQQTYPCNEQNNDGNNGLRNCLKAMDSNAFTAFSNFFTHTHNMCQFLMSQIWRENTAKTISTLSETSARAVEATKQSLSMQDALLANQAETLDYQKQIAANGSALSQALESSRANARALMEEFRASTDEQRALIFSIFDRVGQLQSLVVSEVSWFYTVIFYAGCLLVVYITTATKRTADARIPLIIALTLNFVLERVICSLALYGMNEDDSIAAKDDIGSSWTIHLFDGSRFNVADLPQIISTRIWFARKLTCIVAVIILSYFAYMFKDYNVMNNKLLQDIQQQNMELKKSLAALQISQQNTSTLSQSTSFSVENSLQAFNGKDVTDYDTKIILNEDSGDSDTDSSTLSFNSTHTDRTWMVGTEKTNYSSDESCDDESFYGDDIIEASRTNRNFTIDESFGGHLNDFQIDNLESSHIENVSSTTSSKYKDRSSRSPSLARSTKSSVSNSSYTRSTRVKRRSCTPQISGNLVPLIENVETSHLNKTCYSLRDRSKIMSSREKWDSLENPVLDSESPNSFGKLVKQMARKAEKNSLKVRAAVKKEMELQAATIASSDIEKPVSTLIAYSDDE